MSCILVIDPEIETRRSLTEALSRAGYRALEASTGAEALGLVRAGSPDLVLLELELPDADGEQTLSRLRTQSPWRPLIVISTRPLEVDRVRALDLGADDYLTKPVGDEELLARIRVALRRRAARAQRSDAVINVGDLTLDLDRRLVFARGAEVHLTPNEYSLFAFLMKRVGHVVSYSELLREIRGAKHAEDTSYLRVYMVQLRRKLEVNPSRPIYLLTDANAGYRLHDPRNVDRKV